jgi:hypothetical protein
MMSRAAKDGRALLEAAQKIHAERHGSHTFTPETHLLLQAAGHRIGLNPHRLRYYDAIKDLEYEEATKTTTGSRTTAN